SLGSRSRVCPWRPGQPRRATPVARAFDPMFDLMQREFTMMDRQFAEMDRQMQEFDASVARDIRQLQQPDSFSGRRSNLREGTGTGPRIPPPRTW
ncbi:hypothetical protein TSOC_002806, partial [Tetrabaena socialis]